MFFLPVHISIKCGSICNIEEIRRWIRAFILLRVNSNGRRDENRSMHAIQF